MGDTRKPTNQQTTPTTNLFVHNTYQSIKTDNPKWRLPKQKMLSYKKKNFVE